MNRKQFIFTLLLALLSGLIGGVLSIWFLMPPSVLAQGEPQKVITAEEFRLVDQQGLTKMELRTILGSAKLVLYGENPEMRMVDDTGAMRVRFNPLLLIMSAYNNEFGIDLRGLLSPVLTLRSVGGSSTMVLRSNIFSLIGEKGRIQIDSLAGPSVSLSDVNDRLRARIGEIELKHPRTGSTEIRAPSSLVLFDEEGNVVWSAP